MQPLTIIGTGLAGYGVTRELRKLDPDLPIRLITAEPGASYYKPNLSKSFGAGQSAVDLTLASAEKMAAQLNVEILTETRVSVIRPQQCALTLDNRELAYSRLVLACGADAVIPRIDGASALSVVHSLEDYTRVREALLEQREVVVIGAGLIGCEFANDLAAAGYSVTVVDVEAWPLARLAPRAVGKALMAALSALNVRWALESGVVAVESLGDRHRVHLVDGTILPAGLVLCAIGQRPRTALAAAAGLAVGAGIQVDSYLGTSDSRIYALGDCAEIDGQVHPFVVPIAHSAKALARTLAGTSTAVAFPAMPIVLKTPACPVVLLPPAVAGVVGHWSVTGEGIDLVARYHDEHGRLLAFALTGHAVANRVALVQEWNAARERVGVPS